MEKEADLKQKYNEEVKTYKQGEQYKASGRRLSFRRVSDLLTRPSACPSASCGAWHFSVLLSVALQV